MNSKHGLAESILGTIWPSVSLQFTNETCANFNSGFEFREQIVWGDVKPDNFVLFPSFSMEMKAIDFDAAVKVDEPLTDLFTLRYAPPERAKAALNKERLVARQSYDSSGARLYTGLIVCCLQSGVLASASFAFTWTSLTSIVVMSERR